MSQDLPVNTLAKSINRLAVAAWFLGLVLLAQLVLALVPFVFPSLINSIFPTALEINETQMDVRGSSSLTYNEEPHLNFHTLPVEEKIQLSSVVVLTKLEKTDDGQERHIISEILKKMHETTFNYEVGDEYRSELKGGERAVVFFVGSPARMKYATTFSGSTIHGLDGIPLALLREKCALSEVQ